ncbi:MAG: hypothetical protein ACPLRU_01150 [Desulfofundulus sp.]
MSNTIAARLEAAGVSDYYIDHERGRAVISFPGLAAQETIRQTEERRRQEFQKRYYWTGFELRRREGNGETCIPERV